MHDEMPTEMIKEKLRTCVVVIASYISIIGIYATEDGLLVGQSLCSIYTHVWLYASLGEVARGNECTRIQRRHIDALFLSRLI